MKQCQLNEDDRAEILLSGSGKEEFRVAAHLLTCEPCRQALAHHSSVWMMLDSWTVPNVSLGFNRELFAKIDAVEAEPWYARFTSQVKAMFSQPLLALAVAAVVIFGGFILDHPAGTTSGGSARSAAIQVSNTEAEQVEKTLDDLEMLRQFDLGSEEKETTSKPM